MLGILILMILKSQQTSRDPTGPNHPNFALLSKDNQLEIQTSYLVQSSLFQWKNCSRSRLVNSGPGVVVPIGLVEMVSQRERRWSMLNGWDLEIRERGERDHLGVDCDLGRNESEERGTVTILMSHGYCIIFRCAAYD
jgi:hypothetical protein